MEGKIEVTGRRVRRRKQLLDDLKEKKRYWKLKEEALDRTHPMENSLWKRLRTCRKTDYRMNQNIVDKGVLLNMHDHLMGYVSECIHCARIILLCMALNLFC
jgi:hypothetical protein